MKSRDRHAHSRSVSTSDAFPVDSVESMILESDRVRDTRGGDG